MSQADRSVHVLFHVPEGLEFVAKQEIKKRLELPAQETRFVEEPGTGRLQVIVDHGNLSDTISMLQDTPLSSVYDITLVATKVNMPLHVFNDAQHTHEFISQVTETTQWDPIVEASTHVPTFRATFRKGQLKHACKTQELAGRVGFSFGQRYPDWKVNLEHYDYQVLATWTRQEKEGPITLLLGISLAVPDTRYRHRIHFGRTSLNPAIAYCLVQLADPQPGQVVFDMCCGTGTIPIEGAAAYPDTMWFGSEVKVKTLSEKAQGNVKHAGLSNVDLFLADGRQLCMRDACVDIIISDWPWGLREGSFSTIQKLYPRFMRQIERVLRSHGKAYIVTQGHKLFNRVLAYPWCKEAWNIDRVISIGIGGYPVSLYMLSKKN
ncbi:S-adenosyl-L-methionine-dependent methyltransferase [Lichtheimia hyalospora FSU 10163]|nr:S-adenosyl-L-methionine-dependent methyltransferase [Lichtheimia hyalospora FSU 10163]